MPATDLQLTAHDAAEAWARAAHAYAGELVAIATGPLTDLALALRIEPALPKLLRRQLLSFRLSTISSLGRRQPR